MPKFNQSKLNKLRLIDRLFKAIYFSPKNSMQLPAIEKQSTQQILVLGLMMIGDTIMALPSFRVLKKNFPDATITLVCGSAVKIVLEDQALIDDYIIVKSPWLHKDYSLKNLSEFFGSLSIINKKQYDLAIDFRGDWRNIFFMNFIKAKRKASFNFSGGEYMLTDVIRQNEIHQSYTDEWLYLLKQLGCVYSEEDRVPRLTLSAKKLQYVSSFKQENNLTDKIIVGIHPGASQEVKKWSEKRYAELIIALSSSKPNLKFILFEGPGENESILNIETIIKDENIEYIIVNKKLDEYIALISICDYVICNDSGAAHIARAFLIPTTVIFGNTDPGLINIDSQILKSVTISHKLDCKPCNLPYCKYGHKLCLEGIEVAEVYAPTIKLLEA